MSQCLVPSALLLLIQIATSLCPSFSLNYQFYAVSLGTFNLLLALEKFHIQCFLLFRVSIVVRLLGTQKGLSWLALNVRHWCVWVLGMTTKENEAKRQRTRNPHLLRGS